MSNNIFYIGDAAEIMKKNIKDNSVDCVITSPPYDNLRDYKGFSLDIEAVIKELYRVLKKGGVVIWIVNDKTINGSESTTSFKHALLFTKHNFLLHDTMIYAKNNPIPLNHNRYEQMFEFMFVFSKGKPKTFNPIMIECEKNTKPGNFRQRKDGILEPAHKKEKSKGTKIKGNIWYYSVGNNKSTKDKIAFKHPAIFPEELVLDHINSWTNQGDLILDPFCGSGTTCKMAYLNKREFIGIDLSKEYIDDICKERLSQYGWIDTSVKDKEITKDEKEDITKKEET